MALPQVTPLNARKIYESYGVCAHPTFRTTTYKVIDDWMSRLADMGVYSVRAEYAESNLNQAPFTASLRKYGMKAQWIPAPGNNSQTTDVTVARIQHIAANAADVTLSIEGTNEPDDFSGWATYAYNHQVAIYNTARSLPALNNAVILGPALRGYNAWKSHVSTDPADFPDGSGLRHYDQIRDLGIRSYQDVAAMHQYPSGLIPMTDIQKQADVLRGSYGANYPIWLTETGWHNALDFPQGPRNMSVSEYTSSVYNPRALFQIIVKMGMPMNRYEALDDPAPLKDDGENNYGLWRTPTLTSDSWTPKPEVAEMKKVLSGIKDVPGATSYVPPPVGLKVTGPRDLDYYVTGTSDGIVRLWMFRHLQVWDTWSRVHINVPPAKVRVEDASGVRRFMVGGKMVSTTVAR